jgi:lysophospholipase L1-like esterase
VAVSFLPGIDLPTGDIRIRFPEFTQISDFNYSENSITADSLIDAYLSGDSESAHHVKRANLSGLEPRKKNEFLLNPETNKIKALDNFFSALLQQKTSEIVRIAHYGDSQLEGDRITCYVRTAFQEKFGGSGVGFVPFDDIADNVNLVRYCTPNWIRYTVFHNRYGCGYYGLSGNVYKFSRYTVTKADKDSTEAKDSDSSAAVTETQTIWGSATVGITLRSYITYSKARLMYGRSTEYCKMNVYNQTTGEKILSDSLPPVEGFSLYDLNFPSPIKSFKLEFSSNTSPDFYGLLIDGSNGIQVDNYAIRGHSGDGLLLINADYLITQLKKLNIKLIIFQYGNNVVPYAGTDKKREELQTMYESIFTRFKTLAPDISILVIGAGDMSTMVNGTYVSYPYLSKVRDLQKTAALKAGCAFWDLYEVMGGENSVLTWKKKNLASNDGHFTNKGQKLIGNELFNALLTEYNQYVYRNKKKKGAGD